MSVTITNKEIYNKLLDIESRVIVTNGKVKLNRWMSTSSMALIMMVITVLSIQGV